MRNLMYRKYFPIKPHKIKVLLSAKNRLFHKFQRQFGFILEVAALIDHNGQEKPRPE